MRYFLCGGGDAEKTVAANKKFNEVIDHTKPLLYIPIAMQSDRYDSCYSWISWELKDVDIPSIEMVRSAEEIVTKDLSNYCAIFIGGGNTYKLLNDLKSCEAFDKILEFIINDGIVFGGSAGAIIFGEDISPCKYVDKNEVGLTDTSGFGLFNRCSIYCHFTNETPENTEIAREYLKELSKKMRVVALPEEDTIYYEDGCYEVLGDRPFYIFENGTMITMGSSAKRRREYSKVRTDNDLMDFMNENIAYGWIDKDNRKHLNNLKGFRKNYLISSIDEILDTGLGTCIEQAKFIKYTLDNLGLETKMFCFRSYEVAEDYEEEVKMHCLVLFRYKDKWYHFEHSNIERRGIHEFNSVEEAIQTEIDSLDPADSRELIEIPSIPSGITFKEFNDYVSSFGEKIVKKK